MSVQSRVSDLPLYWEWWGSSSASPSRPPPTHQNRCECLGQGRFRLIACGFVGGGLSGGLIRRSYPAALSKALSSGLIRRLYPRPYPRPLPPHSSASQMRLPPTHRSRYSCTNSGGDVMSVQSLVSELPLYIEAGERVFRGTLFIRKSPPP